MRTSVIVVGAAIAIFGGWNVVTSARAMRDDDSGTWACSTPARFTCAQWESPHDAALLAEQKEGCRHLGGLVATGNCPARDAVGSCGATGSRIVYYAPRDVTQARKACAMLGGTWR